VSASIALIVGALAAAIPNSALEESTPSDLLLEVLTYVRAGNVEALESIVGESISFSDAALSIDHENSADTGSNHKRGSAKVRDFVSYVRSCTIANVRNLGNADYEINWYCSFEKGKVGSLGDSANGATVLLKMIPTGLHLEDFIQDESFWTGPVDIEVKVRRHHG
jgi:hypothetical protein